MIRLDEFVKNDEILLEAKLSPAGVEKAMKILVLLKERFMKGKIDSVSMRAYIAAEDCYRSGLPNWVELLNYA